jgi:outer membrane protein assembly factor BamB
MLTTAAIGAALLLVVSGCDWLQPAFDGGLSNANGYEPALTASTVGSLTQRYTLGSSSAPDSTPIVANGAVYTGTPSGVSAVRAGNGSPLWTTTLATGGSSPKVAYGSGTVFVASASQTQSTAGTLYALDASTGAIQWSDPISGLDGGPVLDGGKVFVTTASTGSVVAIDPGSGATLWTSTFLPSGSQLSGINAIFASAGTVYVNFSTVVIDGFPAANFSAFNESDGTGGNTLGGVGMIADGIAIVGGPSPTGGFESGAIDLSTDATLWLTPTLVIPESMSADLFIQETPTNNGLTALDPHTGVTKWTASLPSGTITAQAVIAGSLVYTIGDDGTSSTLYAFDGATGAQVAAIPVGPASTFSTLVIAEGKVFVTINGTITAYAPTT